MTANQASPVRFGRLERRGLLAGLDGPQVALLAVALVVFVAAQLAAGPVGVVLAAPVWAIAVAVALVPVGGRPAVQALPDAAGWIARRAFGGQKATTPLPPADGLSLPGVPGRLRLTSHPCGAAIVAQGGAARGRGASLIVVAEVRGRGFVLDSAHVQERRVTSWAGLLAALGQTAGVTGAQVLHRSAPDGAGAAVHAWWARQVRDPSGVAGRIVTELLDDAMDGSRVQTLLAVSAAPGRGVAGLAGLLSSLESAIQRAELDLQGWLTPSQLGSVIREACDPYSAGADETPARFLGPMGVSEHWDHLRTDSGFHATYWVSEWPRSGTHPGFLQPILLAPGARRTFTLLARPLPPGRALREIRRARAEQLADAAARARVGRVEDEAARAAAEELSRRESDLVAGHGDLRFVGLLTVTAATLDELTEARAMTETAAAQAGCELRRLVGRQVPAFAAAVLPLVRNLS